MHTIFHRAALGFARSPRPASAFFGYRPGAVLGRAFELLLTWQERASQRHALAAFDDRMLKDIGLTRGDVDQEVRKPFWRP